MGRTIADALADAGASVVLASRTQADLDEAADAITARGGTALPIAAHSGDDAAVAALVERTVAELGGIDILVNNAATNPHFGRLTSEMSQWDKTYDVNVKGYFRWIRACAPHMKARDGGSIINVASVAGERPQPGMGVIASRRPPC